MDPEDMQSIKLASLEEKQDQKIRYYETTTIKLVIAYIFFQAVIFLSVFHQNPAIRCQHWWIPFSLSSLITFIFSISFTRFASKLERMQHQHDITVMERDSNHHRKMLQRRDPTNTHDLLQQQQQILKGDIVNVYLRNGFIYLVFAALLVYSVIILIACRFVICKD
ncbi:unnamed protein product [Prunus armeniaca]|uniref:Uncharacterized protein n=1 Tax=Prunus armeniaca TaxID=36596 RepID=A0A6J5WC45_PRUAR|nr:unnamed protein product [Prunus armeniaca]